MGQGAVCGGQCGLPEEDGLVLGGSAHVVVGIVGELEDVRGEGLLVAGRVAVLCGVLVEDVVGVGGDVFVGVEGDEGGRADGGVDGVCHEALAEAGDDKVVGDIGEAGDVRGGLEPLVCALRHAGPGQKDGRGCGAKEPSVTCVFPLH
jgi:hypothetical protein